MAKEFKEQWKGHELEKLHGAVYNHDPEGKINQYQAKSVDAILVNMRLSPGLKSLLT